MEARNETPGENQNDNELIAISTAISELILQKMNAFCVNTPSNNMVILEKIAESLEDYKKKNELVPSENNIQVLFLTSIIGSLRTILESERVFLKDFGAHFSKLSLEKEKRAAEAVSALDNLKETIKIQAEEAVEKRSITAKEVLKKVQETKKTIKFSLDPSEVHSVGSDSLKLFGEMCDVFVGQMNLLNQYHPDYLTAQQKTLINQMKLLMSFTLFFRLNIYDVTFSLSISMCFVQSYDQTLIDKYEGDIALTAKMIVTEPTTLLPLLQRNNQKLQDIAYTAIIGLYTYKLTKIIGMIHSDQHGKLYSLIEKMLEGAIRCFALLYVDVPASHQTRFNLLYQLIANMIAYNTNEKKQQAKTSNPKYFDTETYQKQFAFIKERTRILAEFQSLINDARPTFPAWSVDYLNKMCVGMMNINTQVLNHDFAEIEEFYKDRKVRDSNEDKRNRLTYLIYLKNHLLRNTIFFGRNAFLLVDLPDVSQIGMNIDFIFLNYEKLISFDKENIKAYRGEVAKLDKIIDSIKIEFLPNGLREKVTDLEGCFDILNADETEGAIKYTEQDENKAIKKGLRLCNNVPSALLTHSYTRAYFNLASLCLEFEKTIRAFNPIHFKVGFSALHVALEKQNKLLGELTVFYKIPTSENHPITLRQLVRFMHSSLCDTVIELDKKLAKLDPNKLSEEFLEKTVDELRLLSGNLEIFSHLVLSSDVEKERNILLAAFEKFNAPRTKKLCGKVDNFKEGSQAKEVKKKKPKKNNRQIKKELRIRKKQEEEARRKQEEEAKKQEEEARRKQEEEAKKQEEEARRKQEEEARKRQAEAARKREAEAARKKQAEAARKKRAEEARKKQEEEARKKQEEEARKKLEEEAKKQAEEARKKQEEEARKKQEEEARKKQEEEARKKQEEEARKQAEEARKKQEEEARKKQEEEARKKQEEEAAARAELLRSVEKKDREWKVFNREYKAKQLALRRGASQLPQDESKNTPRKEEVAVNPPPARAEGNDQIQEEGEYQETLPQQVMPYVPPYHLSFGLFAPPAEYPGITQDESEQYLLAQGEHPIATPEKGIFKVEIKNENGREQYKISLEGVNELNKPEGLFIQFSGGAWLTPSIRLETRYGTKYFRFEVKKSEDERAVIVNKTYVSQEGTTIYFPVKKNGASLIVQFDLKVNPRLGFDILYQRPQQEALVSNSYRSRK